jgi:predicted SnoaL-like aldol condensation-catalyzing enzyme
VHAINKFFETGDVSLIEQGIAIGAIDHAAPGGDLVAGNLDSVKAYFTRMRNQFTDMKMEIVKEWADEEYVLQWINFLVPQDSQSGTCRQRIDGMTNLHISKLKDGKAAEHWEFAQPNDR